MRARERDRRVGRDIGINDRKKGRQRRNVQETRSNHALSCHTVQAVRFPMKAQQPPSHQR